MSAPSILCIAGSPRPRGTTDHLLDRAVCGIRDAGVEADVLAVRDHAIAPCQGCHACSKTGRCRIDDEMQAVYPRLDGAAGLVIATPVYFATVPALLKALYDRCQPYWARRYVLGESERGPRRPAGLIVAGGGGDPYGLDGAVITTKSVLAVTGFTLQEHVLLQGADNPSDLSRFTREVAAAEQLGARVAQAAVAR